MLWGNPISRSALRIASTASPSAAPGARLNDTVVAGNWPRWLIANGAVCSMICATADSGTCPFVAVDDGREIALNDDRDCRNFGAASRITRYWFDCVKIVGTMR